MQEIIKEANIGYNYQLKPAKYSELHQYMPHNFNIHFLINVSFKVTSHVLIRTT